MGEGRILEGLAVLNLLRGVAVVIVLSGKLDGRTVWGEGLNEDLSLDLATPRSTCDLNKELEGALRCSEIRQIQGKIGVEDPDEGDVRKVEALGDHLGANQNVQLLGAEVTQGISELILSLASCQYRLGQCGHAEIPRAPMPRHAQCQILRI